MTNEGVVGGRRTTTKEFKQCLAKSCLLYLGARVNFHVAVFKVPARKEIYTTRKDGFGIVVNLGKPLSVVVNVLVV
jgi:hypothetical protein